MNSVFNILDMLDSIGEERVKAVLSDFACPKNNEIEDFLHKNAIEFAKRKMSVTYLVFNDEKQFVGYFTLTHKHSSVNNDVLSNNSRKRLERQARYDETTNSYEVSAFLIAQFGKNYAYDSQISGDRLMDYVFDVLYKIQHLIGGGIVFLECEDNEKLLEFYQSENNGFKKYGERFSDRDNKKYLQLLKFF